MPRYQRKDAFHQRAKREGYRSRAAYKLAEIAERARLIGTGARVADLGCWPGGWLQVASERVGPKGRVVGVDLAPIEPPLENANVVALVGDIAQPAVVAEVLAALGGPADVLLSDAAPKLTGIRDTDRAREEAVLEAVATALPQLLREGGDLLCKLLDGPEAQAVAKRIGAGFRESRTLRPEATRKGSAERYLLARGYRASRAGRGAQRAAGERSSEKGT